MNIALYPSINAVLTKAKSDRKVTSDAFDMLQFYAGTLATDGPIDIDEYAYEFAEGPPMYYQILEEWDGEDPEAGLSTFGTIFEAMSARIFECNLEKITNDTVRMYWDELSKSPNNKSEVALQT